MPAGEAAGRRAVDVARAERELTEAEPAGGRRPPGRAASDQWGVPVSRSSDSARESAEP